MQKRAHLLLLFVIAASAFPLDAFGLDLDGDGMSDVWQRIFGISSSEVNDDPDGDGKTNLQESLAGTDPYDSTSALVADAVQDDAGNILIEWRTITGKRYQVEKITELAVPGPSDWQPLGSPVLGNGEYLSVSDSLSAAKSFYRVKMLPSLNSDADALDDWEESLLGTSPLSDDTDSDGISDSAEFIAFLSPTNADTDGDGIPDNIEITVYLTDPLSRDTDRDGVDDNIETGYAALIAQQQGGTNPLDPTDAFPANPEQRQVKVRMFFRGTWPNYSGSPPPLPAINFSIGTAATITQAIVTSTPSPNGIYFGATNNTTDKPINRGTSYPYTLTFAGAVGTWPTVVARGWGSPTNPAAERANLLIYTPGKGYFISNDEGGVWSESAWQPTGNGSITTTAEQQLEARNFGSGTFWAATFDLDIDSDDNDGIAVPPRTLVEEDLEETQPKAVLLNINDDDNDSTADYADLSNAQEQDLVPLVLETAPSDLEWNRVKIKFRYSGNSTYNSGRVGEMRLWKASSARVARTSADYIEPDHIYTAADLGLSASNTQLKLFVEGLNVTMGTREIEAVFIFNDHEYFHDKVLVQVKAEKAEFVKHTPPNELLYIATASRVDAQNHVEVTADVKLTAQPSFNLGTITSTRGASDTIAPNTGTTNAQGQFTTKLRTRTLDATPARVQFNGADGNPVQSGPLTMQLPVKYESDFLITFYTTYSENDPAFTGGPVVNNTTLRAGGVRQYYFINSAVAAHEGFLRETALQGYGYLADGRLVRPEITPAAVPNPLPPGTNRNWRFLNANIVVLPASSQPLGNAGNPLVDGSSSAIVRGAGGRGVVIPNLATFTVEGRPEVRTADDRVTGDAGVYHVDLYRLDTRANIQAGTIRNGRITLQTQP